VTQVPWKRGRCLAWDATCPNTFAQSYIQDSSTLDGSAASAAELNKIAKYSDIRAGVDFVPFVNETSGVWGEQAMSLVKELGRRMGEVNKEPRSTMFLRQRLSVAVQHGNAAFILGTLRPNLLFLLHISLIIIIITYGSLRSTWLVLSTKCRTSH